MTKHVQTIQLVHSTSLGLSVWVAELEKLQIKDGTAPDNNDVNGMIFNGTPFRET